MTSASLRLALLLSLVVGVSACDSATTEATDSADLTAAEVTEATEIVAQALAQDDGGLMASAADLTASFSDTGEFGAPRALRLGTRGLPQPCRGGQSLTYDEATGTHRIGYRCGVQNATSQKGYGVQLAYQFRDADAGFVARPWNAWDSVDSVAFRGTRQGFVRQTRRDSVRSESQFEQSGAWTLSNLSDDTTPAVLAGRQSREGSWTRSGAGGRASRTFSVELGSREILIRESQDGLTYAASGEIAYTLTMEVVRRGRTQTRTVEGTITLDGNTRALLRVVGLRNVYRVSLADGSTERQV